jgi:hypothetical protein
MHVYVVCVCESECVCLKRRGVEFQAHQPRLMRRAPLSRHGCLLARGVIGCPPSPFGRRARRAGDEMPPRPPPVLRPTTTRSTRGAWRRRDQVVRLARLLLLSSPPTWIYHSWSLVSLVLHTLPHCTFARSLFHARFVAPTLITLHHLPLNDLTISASAHRFPATTQHQPTSSCVTLPPWC